ncbi:V-type ATP synthase subunit I [Lachnoclostridium sp.]|uniref:V-type ATP synthase subunit I n=1 Tax=Lachnoclostridium sp. TaxID=2028282 RepID=UPI0028A1B861|nr:V-type ATP synthase subunit I [Lachnoclostridium sp.]
MSVLNMQKIQLCALKRNRKKLLITLQRCGVMEVTDIYYDDSIFHQQKQSEVENFVAEDMQLAKEALQVLDTYCDKKTKVSSLTGRKLITTEKYEDYESKYNQIKERALQITQLARIITEEVQENKKRRAQLEALVPWITLTIPFSCTETNCTAVFFGTLPNAWDKSKVEKLFSDSLNTTETSLFVEAEVISTSKLMTCLMVMCLKKQAVEVLTILRDASFSQKISNCNLNLPPAKEKEKIEEEILASEDKIAEYLEMIKEFEQYSDEFQFLSDDAEVRFEQGEVMKHLIETENVFVVSGYIPKDEIAKTLKKIQEQCDVAIETMNISEEEEVPILLKNPAFSQPLEGTVKAYSLPGKGEIDPTTIMAVFYYILFGIMLADAAYGAIMVIGCTFALLKYKNMENSLKNSLKMFLYCGISTIFWGVMFGSYFGDMVDVVSETFFGHKISIPPVWFFPVNEPMKMLVFSMLFGIIHIYTGLAVKLYQCLKQKDYKSILYDVILWYIVLTASLVLLLSMDVFTKTFGLSFQLSKKAGNIALVIMLISSVGIILTAGRESRNPIKRFLKGLYGYYGITGYLSDVLSYSRLLALGLASGVICTVINMMASMVGGGFVGVIAFIVIFILGHAINIGINALGAYVHTNRLQYVEFFGKFYSGGGREFSPFSMRTKYFKLDEGEK